MKPRLLSFAVFTVAMFTCVNASAGPGYKATVWYQSAGDPVPISVWGPTPEACERNKWDLIDRLQPYVDSYSPCILNVEDIEIPQFEPQFEIPDCWYCSLINEQTIGVLYPDKHDAVLNLFYKYNMDSYNAELRNLELKYDVQGFEQELHSLIQELNQ